MTAGERVRELRLRLGLTQEQVGERAGLERTKIVDIEHGKNQASTWLVRRGLATAFRLRVETLSDFLDGAITVDDAERRSREGEGAVVSRRLRDRPEWPEVAAAAQAAATVTDPDLRQEDFDRAGRLYDGESMPKQLSPRMVVQFARAIRSA